MSEKPVIAITTGDPAGIGPEIIVRGWKEFASDPRCRFVVFGNPFYLEREARQLSLPSGIVTLTSLEELDDVPPSAIPCIPTGERNPIEPVRYGVLSKLAGREALDSIEGAIASALRGEVVAIVTPPINKMAIHLAGSPFPGHTELFAARWNIPDYAMMLYIPAGQGVGGEIGTGVVHTTLHQSLRSAIDNLSSERILECARLADEFGRRLLRFSGLSRTPRIAVAALNPHAGEQGLFGDEESRIIEPAIRLARSDGIDCTGPVSCDTLMGRAARGEFDLVVAMYHDQGHIALKLLGMHKAVNVTLGLPVIRTSVAHGTAYEIAGKGLADPSSMIRAVDVATALVCGTAID